MTVEQLIAILATHPSDLEVVVECNSAYVTVSDIAAIDLVDRRGYLDVPQPYREWQFSSDETRNKIIQLAAEDQLKKHPYLLIT